MNFSGDGFLVDSSNMEQTETDERKTNVFPQKEKKTATHESLSKNLSVPFRGHITGGLRPGKKLVMIGVVDPYPDRFYVALTCGAGISQMPPEDVALEICVRFRDRQIQLRACESGVWGEMQPEAPFFPFIRGLPFKLEINCEQSRLRVFVDGEKLFEFHHRITALSDIDTLWIKGSLTLNKLA